MAIVSLRHADPRALLLVAAGSALCFSLLQTMHMAGTGLALALIFAVLCGPGWGLLLQRLLLANVFVLFVWLTVPWTMPGAGPGTSVLSVGPLHFSWEGIMLAMAVTIKCNAILLAFLTLMAEMQLSDMGCALEKLRVPAKLVFLFLFTCRYIHVVSEEWKKLQTAACLRGFVMQTSLHTYRTIANMLGLTVVNSIARSHRIYEAMLLRGFNGHFHMAGECQAGRRDIVFVSSACFVFVCLLCADLYITYCHV